MIEIKKVETKRQLKKFIRFNYELYKDNRFSVPDLYEDMLHTFRQDRNPAFEFCEADYFLAYKDGQLAGRVAAIINHRANETWKKKTVRFGWIDFIDDAQVAEALIQEVEDWGKQRGMTTIEGPLGFTDMDAEGMLIDGFEELSTMASIYNYPYYPQHIEALGFEKAADWTERKVMIPEVIPEKHLRISELTMKRYGLHTVPLNSKKEIIAKGIGRQLFDLINSAYAPLFGYSQLSDAQIDQYVKQYIPLLDMRMVTAVANNEGEIVGTAISMPSLSRALQKARGRLFPFGWFYLLRALKWKRSKVLDLLLMAVRPDYQGKGVNAIVFTNLIKSYQEMGFEYAETNPELELNNKMQNQWSNFETQQHKRRRCYVKTVVGKPSAKKNKKKNKAKGNNQA